MILIISSIMDVTTQKISDWLSIFGKEHIIIHEKNQIDSYYLNISKEDIDSESWISIKGNRININEIQTVWLRKVITPFIVPIFKPRIKYKVEIQDEIAKTTEYLFELFSLKNSIGFSYPNDVNKLLILKKAIEAGFLVPESKIILGTNSSRIDVILSEPQITKPIGMGILSSSGNKLLFSRTKRINSNEFKNSNISIPTLIQKEVRKLFELRIFFFRDQFWGMAIFSQNDKKTEVDFRNYNYRKPTRMIPFAIPDDLELKLKKFNNLIRLNTGSFDFLVDDKYNYYFLEVNPFGQFGFLSDACNYNIEKSIAKML